MARDRCWTRLSKRLAEGGAIYAMQHPRMLRTVAAFVRHLGIWSPAAIVRYADVTAVLGRETDFTSAEAYAPNILTQPFLLGLDHAPLYNRDKNLLCKVVRRADLEDIRKSLHAFLADLASSLGTSFDVVDDVAVKAATHVITDYFGVPAHPELKIWLRRLAAFIVVGRMADERTCALAQEAADGVRNHVQLAVAARKRSYNPAAPDSRDVLGRLLQEMHGAQRPEDEATVVRNLTGLLWVSHAVIVQALALAVDELLRHPAALHAAHEAATAGDAAAMTAYTHEALRFNPVFGLLPRYCPRDTVVIDASGKRRAIAADTGMLVWAIGAMFDPANFQDPTRFSAARDKGRYLIYGYGMHTCFGEHMADVEVPEMMLAMLKRPGLRRAAGASGRIRYEGPAVAHLYLECDHGPAAGERAERA